MRPHPWRRWAIRERARESLSRYLETPAARLLVRLKITPNAITVAGLLVTALAAYLVSQDELLIGGLVFLFASVMDMLDGAVARLKGEESAFGAALDSLADRLGEAVVLLGAAALFLHRDSDAGVMIAFLAMVSSFSVSYIRARGEGLGVAMKESGLFTRTERVLVLTVGLLTGWLVPALSVMIALSVVSSAQRVYALWRGTRADRPTD